MTLQETKPCGFKELGIHPELIMLLEKQKITVPTPIQKQCISSCLDGKDIVGIAQTGTGKTLAFGLPIIQKISEHKSNKCLIILPTRELALQVNEELVKLGNAFKIKTAVLIGGESSFKQRQQLRYRPQIVIATPGRLNDHLQQKNYSLTGLDTIILDEADQMLDIGFLPQIKMILADAPKNRQTLMFSATMPAPIAEISAKHMRQPLRIAVAPSGTPAQNIAQEIYILPQELKLCLLNKILKEQVGLILVFSRTKHGAKKITAAVNQMGHQAIDIHSNKSLGQRKQALAGFKNGKYRVLVATDIAARGIDVKNIAMVINYDLPDNCEDYVHRIGRTGRAGNSGKAVSFATGKQFSDIKQIERLIKRSIPISKLPVLPKFIAQKPTFQDRSPNYRSRKPEWKRKTGFTQNRSRNFNSKYQRQKAN